VSSPTHLHEEPPPAAMPTSAGQRFILLGVGEMFARLAAFGVTVYLARTLGAGTYGVIVSATTIVLYLAFVADAGMDMTGVREVAAHPRRVPALLGAVLGSRLAIVAGLLALTTLTGWFVLPAPDGPVLMLYAGTLVATAMGTRWVHLGLDRAAYAASSRIVSESVVAVLVLSLVRGPEHLLRVPLAQIAGDLLAAVLLLRLLPAEARPSRLRVDLATTTELLRGSWPMVLHGLLGLAIFNSDFLFLRVLKDAASVGYYAVAYTLISFVQNLGVAYTLSLIPSLTAVRADRRAAQTVVDDAMAQAMFGALPVTIGGLLVAAPLVALLFGPAYVPSVAPLQALLLLVPVALVRNVWQAVLVAAERQDLMLRTVVWAAATNVVLNVVLIPPYGMIGAAAATVVTEAVRTWLSGRYAATLSMRMPPIGRFWKVLAAVGGMAIVVAALRERPAFVTVPAGAVAYAAVLLATRGLRFRRGALPDLPL
jgi:O-antigen/teichoic acid export membrane protein